MALLIAGVSALYARQQAHAARQTARIEQDRRHEERAPKFKAHVESMGGWYQMWLRLETPDSISSLTCQLVGADGIAFGHGQNGVDPSLPVPVKRATWDQILGQSDSACWKIDLTDGHKTEFQLRVLCRGERNEMWPVTVPVSILPLPEVV